MEGWVDLGDQLHIEMVYPTADSAHISTNPAAHGRELNLWPVDHKPDALTTTHQASLLYLLFIRCLAYNDNDDDQHETISSTVLAVSWWLKLTHLLVSRLWPAVALTWRHLGCQYDRGRRPSAGKSDHDSSHSRLLGCVQTRVLYAPTGQNLSHHIRNTLLFVII